MLLESTGQKFANRDMVLQLCQPEVSEYERGKIQGKIEMLSFLLNELTGSRQDVGGGF